MYFLSNHKILFFSNTFIISKFGFGVAKVLALFSCVATKKVCVFIIINIYIYNNTSFLQYGGSCKY